MNFDYRKLNTRLYLLSILAGLFAGIFASLFRIVLNKTVYLRDFLFQHDISILFHIGVIVFIWIVLIAVNWTKNHVHYIGGSGIPQSRAVIIGRYKFQKPLIEFISKFIGSSSAIGVGLSLGREGPSVEMGALGSTMIAKIFHSGPTEKRYLTSAGSAAGLSAAFTAPIASTIFLIEDTLGWVSLRVILPALIACFISGYCAQIMIPTNIYATITTTAPDLNGFWLFIVLTILAILATLGGKLFNFVLFKSQSIYQKLTIPTWIKLLAISIMTYIIGMFIIDITAGGEQELVKQVMSSQGSVWWLLCLIIIKIFFTAFCYSAKLCGSLLLPLIVMGGLLGKAYGLLLVQLGIVDPACCSYFTIIGMSLFFISVVRATLSGLMLILEMTTQYAVFFPMVLTGTLTFLFGQYVGIRPVYHQLYNDMFVKDTNKYSEVRFEVNEHSYIAGMKILDLRLPLYCTVVDILRDNKVLVPESDEELIELGDVLTIRIPTKKYMEAFRILRAITNE